MAGNGFGPSFFEEVLGRESNPLRETLGQLRPTAPTYGSTFGAPYAAPESSRGILSIIQPRPFERGALSQQRNPEQDPTTGAAPQNEGKIAKARREAAEKAQAAAGGGELDATVDPANPLAQRAAQIAQEEGVNPDIFGRLIAVESRYNQNAVNIRSGAGGLTGLMPNTARELGVTDVFDPEQSLRGGARYLKQMLDRFGGDYNLALAAYNAGPGNVESYGGVPPFGETQKYVRAITGAAPPHTGQPEQQSQAQNGLPTPPAGVRPLRGITTAQYGEEGLATGAADYICGPIAAQAFVRTQGRNPTLREALDLARNQGLIDAASGMHGVGSTVQLIRSLGGTASQGKVDKSQIIAELNAGRPVIIDTDAGSRGHYFVIEGYDPSTDQFDFGNSARALKASRGNSLYRLEDISSLGFGSPHAAIYAH